MQSSWKSAAVIAVLGVSGAAHAHEFTCHKNIRVDGVLQEGTPRVTRFPATLRFEYSLQNIHPTAESVATLVEEPLLASYGSGALFPTPMAVGVGQSREASFELTLDSPEACQALAGSDGKQDENFDSALRVKWALGETQCAARVACCEPFVDCEMACPPDDPSCVEIILQRVDPSRNAGFFKVHEQALASCLASGRIELGLARVDSLESALGLLWASPGIDRKGEVRGARDAQRVELAREALVATCNERLFGANPVRGLALGQAVSTLSVTWQGADLQRLTQELRRYNEAGTGRPLPAGVDAGRATPAHAASLAVDPILPSRP